MTLRPFATVLLLTACAAHPRLARSDVQIHTFTHDSSNVYLLVGEGGLVLVDSGYERNAEKLDADIRAVDLDPAALSAVIVTHGHADHAGGASWFHEQYGTRIIAGAGDRAMLAAGANEPLCPTGALGRLRRPTDQQATFTPFAADVLVDAPTPLGPLTGIEGTILPLAGHTGGSLVVSLDDSVLVGDLFRGALVGSGAATHLYMCDLEANQRDILDLIDTVAPRADQFFTGHFGSVNRAAVEREFRRGAR